MTPRRNGIIFIGPIPPPVNGMAVVSEAMVFDLAKQVDVETLVVQATGRGRLRSHVDKAISALRAIVRLAGARRRGAGLLYIAVDDGLGGLWAIIFLVMARALRLRIFLHHHSFRYIVARTNMMRAIVRAAGRDARHVMLCDDMERAFGRLYPLAQRFFIAPNAVETPPPTRRAPPSQARLTIGILSNLSLEKGTAEFIDIVERARARGFDIGGKLAGPARSEAVAELIRTKLTALGDALEWLGPVKGESKEAFFSSIDLFIFPTRYRTETFPLVLLEALTRGVPVIVPRRGCICLVQSIEAAKILSLDEDFGDGALEIVANLYRDRAMLGRLSASAISEAAQLNGEYRSKQLELVHEMVQEARGR